jgi:hypothetical protein
MLSAKYFLIEIKYFFRDNNIFQRQLNSRKKSKIHVKMADLLCSKNDFYS